MYVFAFFIFFFTISLMGIAYNNLIRPLLFRQDPEKSHETAVLALKFLTHLTPLRWLMEKYNRVEVPPVKLFGLSFPGPVGLAAGFDKNAQIWPAAAALGFGFVEVGTVTYHAQSGNPKPRLFRFPEERAVINRMGFNNDGAAAVADRLAQDFESFSKKIPIGINIGKSKITPIEEAAEDYVASFALLAPFADYFVINVSSPNTEGLRSLQSRSHLSTLLSTIQTANLEWAKKMGRPLIPILVKISPDLTFREMDDALETITECRVSGIIATNTTLSRPGNFAQVDTQGGLSGQPLLPLSTQVISYIHKATEGRLPIIGVGGITDAASAGQIMDAGASLLQIYTGLIYEGPFLAKKITQALKWRKSDWV